MKSKLNWKKPDPNNLPLGGVLAIDEYQKVLFGTLREDLICWNGGTEDEIKCYQYAEIEMPWEDSPEVKASRVKEIVSIESLRGNVDENEYPDGWEHCEYVEAIATHTDFEKNYQNVDYIVQRTSDGKFFKVGGLQFSDRFECIYNEAEEVFPVTKMITVYE